MRGLVRFGLGAALAASSVFGGVTTSVALRTQDPALPKLGLPSLRVQVQGAGPVAIDTLRGWITADVLRLTHTKDGADDVAPDYTLVVRFLEGGEDPQDVAFEASLITHDGSPAWIADGRTTAAGPIADPAAWRTIGRNVISALLRDGWLEPKYDPNDPPPATPIVSPSR